MNSRLTRRQFLEQSAALAGLSALSPRAALEPNVHRGATDSVTLGKTGLRLSRLGFGTGSNGGSVQRALGQAEFNRLISYAYDRGIRYIDTADMYQTHLMVREAIKGLPREQLFIQSKMLWDRPKPPAEPLKVLDRFRQELGVEYLDSLLLHCANQANWDQHLKPMMDAFEEAKEKKLIRAHGVSCHGLPALRRAAQVDWVDVHLLRADRPGLAELERRPLA